MVAEVALAVPRLPDGQQRRCGAAGVVEKITDVGGVITSEAWWVSQSGPAGLLLSDEGIDWIEEIANGETPSPGTHRRS